MLQHIKPEHVRLRLFNRAVEILQLLPRRGLAAIHRDLMRPDPMAHLMRQNVREEGFEIADEACAPAQHHL